jgi:lysophospholipid acyltransferase (LPLAT)-like uncharacterized protein
MLRRGQHDPAPMLQRLIRHPRTQAVLARLLAAYLALAYRTTRWTLLGEEHFPTVLRGPEGQPRGAIIAFWHERLTLIPMLWILANRQAAAELRGREVFVLISGHRDGRLISRVIARLGLQTVVGSTSSGARAGAIGLLRRLRQAHYIGITPDGPRGPRRRAAPGVAELAAMAGVPVCPIGASTTRARVFRSWDRAMLPLPFGRGVLVLGAPIMVARDDASAALPGIEAALTAACETADAWAAAQQAA